MQSDPRQIFLQYTFNYISDRFRKTIYRVAVLGRPLSRDRRDLQKLLSQACRRGEFVLIGELLRSGVTGNLHKNCKNLGLCGSVEAIDTYLRYLNPGEVRVARQCILESAAKAGHDHILETFPDNRVEWSSMVYRLVHNACKHGRGSIVKILLEPRIARDEYAIELAVKRGHLHLLPLFEELGWNTASPAVFGALARHSFLEHMRRYVETRPGFPYKQPAGDFALLSACSRGHTDIVKWLLEEFDASTRVKERALCSAAEHGQTSVVRLLLRYVDSFSPKSLEDALRCSAREGYLDIVKLLVSCGARNYVSGKNFAEWMGNEEIAAYLDELWLRNEESRSTPSDDVTAQS